MKTTFTTTDLGLAALILFNEYTTRLKDHHQFSGIVFSLSDPWVIAGLFIGGLMPFLPPPPLPIRIERQLPFARRG